MPTTDHPAPGLERTARADAKKNSQQAIADRFDNINAPRQQFRLQRKRLLWLTVINATYFIKRLFDILFSAACLLILALPLALLALAIKLNSPGPALFPQTRVGRWGNTFTMWKFRSMYIDAEARKAKLLAENEMSGGVIFKMRRDPRITSIGRFIRKASIDELPQLWNVLKGDMSVVGPRPPLPSEVANYSLQDRRRLDVIPGITCIWQVSGRSDIPFDQQVELDVQYIDSQSFFHDMMILLRTVPAVLLGKGAY